MHRTVLTRLTLAVVLILAMLLAYSTVASGSQVDRIFADGFESPQPPPDPCFAAVPPNLQPVWRQWQQAFSSPNGNFQANFPNSPPGPVPIGAEKTGLTVIGFIAPVNLSVGITWDQAQPNGQYGYGMPRVNNGGMFIGLSDCPGGDLRPINNTSPDQFLRPICRTFNTQGGLFYTTTGSFPHICQLQPNKVYYYTFSPRNPNVDDYQETCYNDNYTGCDVQVVSRGYANQFDAWIQSLLTMPLD